MSVVLFICKENGYRSQIAEALFNSMSTKHTAISAAGASPAPSINNDAVMLLKRIYGIDMSTQKPKALTKAMIDKADIIITVCDPKDCVLVQNSEKVRHWVIQKMEDKDEIEKESILRDLYYKVSELVRELET